MSQQRDYLAFARLLLQSYRQTRFSLLMLLSALLIATSGLSAVLIINHSAKQSYQQDTTFLLPNVSHQVVASNAQQGISKQDYAQLKRLGFTELVAYASTKHDLFSELGPLSESNTLITGIDFVSALALPAFQQSMQRDALTNSTNKPLGLAFANNLAFAHPNFIAGLTQASGAQDSPLRLDATDGPALPSLRAVNEASLGNDIVLDINTYFKLVPEAKLSGLLWLSQSKTSDATRVDLLSKALPAHLKLVTLATGAQQGELTKSFHLNLLAMALLMFVVCLFIVLNAVNLLLNARMPWLKISRQLGISRMAMFAVQIAELVLFNLVMCALGIVLGLYLANAVAPSVQATLASLYKVKVGFGHISLATLYVQIFCISVFGSALALLVPFKQLNMALSQTHIPPPSKLQHRRWQRRLMSLACVLAASSFLLLFFATQLWLLLVAVACLILCGCVLLLLSYAGTLSLLFRLIPERFILLKVSVKQSIALSSKSKIACCAFFIAATSNIGMNLMVDSFRGATFSWLDTRLAADYYLYYQGDTDLSTIAKQTQVVLNKRYEKYVQYQGLNIQEYSYPSSDTFKNAMVYYRVADAEQAWQDFINNKGIFVNQQFAFHFNTSLGDTINLPQPDSELPRNYKIVGIIYDFGSPNKQVLLPVSAFDPSNSKTYLYALEGNEQHIQAFKQKLTALGMADEISLLKTADLLTMSMQTFDKTFFITDGLNVVTLLVAALSLACAIILLNKDLTPQNMLIRALGVSKLKVQLLALFQYLLLCMVALIFATPFGIGLSWVLINQINYHAFQWTYPLQVDITTLLLIYATSLCVVLLVIFIPTFRASHKPLIEDIRWLN
jgi:putative ABC transport system permease protein